MRAGQDTCPGKFLIPPHSGPASRILPDMYSDPFKPAGFEIPGVIVSVPDQPEEILELFLRPGTFVSIITGTVKMRQIGKTDAMFRKILPLHRIDHRVLCKKLLPFRTGSLPFNEDALRPCDWRGGSGFFIGRSLFSLLNSTRFFFKGTIRCRLSFPGFTCWCHGFVHRILSIVYHARGRVVFILFRSPFRSYRASS